MPSFRSLACIFIALVWLTSLSCNNGGRAAETNLKNKDSLKITQEGEPNSLFEDENRDIWQKPDRVIDLLGPLSNKTIVDLGAASGYFSFRLLPHAGKVIAVDIDPKYIQFLEDKRALLSDEQQQKFETRLAKPDDPLLADGEADAILLVSTYVYIGDRIAYFSRLRKKLASEGKIVIIEFKKKFIPNGPPDDEKVSLSQVERELREAGYASIQTDDRTLDYQYIVTARAK